MFSEMSVLDLNKHVYMYMIFIGPTPMRSVIHSFTCSVHPNISNLLINIQIGRWYLKPPWWENVAKIPERREKECPFLVGQSFHVAWYDWLKDFGIWWHWVIWLANEIERVFMLRFSDMNYFLIRPTLWYVGLVIRNVYLLYVHYLCLCHLELQACGCRATSCLQLSSCS